MSENLTCPFCGTTPEILHDTFAFCDHVGCHIEHHVVPIEAWNHRAAPAIAGQIKYLRERLESERQERIAAMVQVEGLRRDNEMLARCVDELRNSMNDASCHFCQHDNGGDGDEKCMFCKRASVDQFEPAPADGAGKGGPDAAIGRCLWPITEANCGHCEYFKDGTCLA